MIMSNGGSMFSDLARLVVIVALIAIVAGVALSGTDLLNFNTSGADMRAKDQATTTQTKKDAIDLELYQAQKRNEIVTIEASTNAQQQAIALQAVKNWVDQQVYRIQQTTQAMKQVADARQYEALQLAQAEAERQRQLAQVEVQREQQLAQIRAAEQNQAQQRAEQAARTAQDLRSANLLSTAVASAMIVIAVAVAAVVIFGAVALIWPRLQRARLESTVAKIAAQLQPGRTAAPEPDAQTQPIQATALRFEKAPSELTMPQRDDHEYWKEKRIQARANEVVLRNMQLQGDLPQGLKRVNYQDLPLAAMKNDLKDNDSDLNGQVRSS